MSQFLFFGSALIEQDVGPVMGAIITVLSAIMNVIMNVVSNITERHSLGITIILMTVVIRILMLPQGIQAIKSSTKMKTLQPEIEKLNKKYGSSKDPEVVRKKNAEQQELYRKHKINPLGGCLPLLITMPIFIALFDMLRRLPWFIRRIQDLYQDIWHTLVRIPDIIYGQTIVDGVTVPGSELFEMAIRKTNPAILTDFYQEWGRPINIGTHLPDGSVNEYAAQDFSRFVDTFSPGEWDRIKEIITESGYEHASDVQYNLSLLLDQRENIQTFLGVNLVQAVNAGGIFTPAIIIPILSGGTSFLHSYINMKLNPPAASQNMKMQRIMMLVAMPAMMFFFTFNISGGVGVYWIAGNVIAILQHILLMKFYFNRKPKVIVE